MYRLKRRIQSKSPGMVDPWKPYDHIGIFASSLSIPQVPIKWHKSYVASLECRGLQTMLTRSPGAAVSCSAFFKRILWSTTDLTKWPSSVNSSSTTTPSTFKLAALRYERSFLIICSKKDVLPTLLVITLPTYRSSFKIWCYNQVPVHQVIYF